MKHLPMILFPIVGGIGFILLLCEAETIIALVLSKVVAIVFMAIAYKLYKAAEKNGSLDSLKRFF